MNLRFVSTLVLALSVVVSASSQVPLFLNHQGFLTTPAGVALDTTVAVTYRIYTDSLGGAENFSQTFANVSVQRGVFRSTLGPINLSFDTQYWLEVQVGTEILSPRTRLTTSAYAFRADTANSVSPAAAINVASLTTTGNATIGGTAQVGSFRLPTGAFSGRVLTSDGTGNGTWQALPAGLGGSGTAGQVSYWINPNTLSGSSNFFWDNLNVRLGVGTASPAVLLDLGLAGSRAGILRMAGSSSGNVTIQPAASAGTWTLTLPTSSGSAGQALTTNGAGVTSWSTVGTVTSITAGTGLSGGTITTSGTISLNLASANTWTGAQTFNANTNFPGTSIWTSGGNIGLGTTSPGYRIVTQTPANNYSYVHTDGTITLGTYINSFYTSGMIGTLTAHPFQIYTSNAGPVMTLTAGGLASGNMGVGTVSPTARVHAITTVAGARASRFENTATSSDGIGVHGRSVNADGFGYGGFFEGGWYGVYASGQAGAYTGSGYGILGIATGSAGARYGVYGLVSGTATTRRAVYAAGDLQYTGSLIGPSDRQLKQNIQPIGSSLAKVMQLEPRTFTYRTDAEVQTMNLSQGIQYGFVAQELEEIFPELIVESLHPLTQPGERESEERFLSYKGVKYVELIPVLIQAIKEQQEMIEELQTEIERLKNR